MDFPKSVPNIGLVGGKFADENVGTGQPGSLIPAQWGNSVTLEILNVLAAAGIVPDELKTDQLATAISRIVTSGVTWAKVTGKPTTVDGFGITDALKLSGGTLTGPLNLSNGSSAYLQTATQGSWVAGLIAGSFGNETAGVGFTGNASVVSGAFIGIGATPWASGNGVRITGAGVTITGAISGNGSGLTSIPWTSLASKPTTLGGYGIADAYTKTGTDNAINASAATLVGRDGISVAGLVGGDQTRPYMRDAVTNDVLQLQRRLGFDPIQQGGGIGQSANKVYLGMSGALNRPTITVDTTNFGGIAFISDLPAASPITKEFGSAQQAVSNGGLVSVAHGLGVVPKIIIGELVCVNAENGWVPGDIQHVSLSPDNDDAGVVVGFGARKDATNIYARCGVSGPYGININNGNAATPTAANWRLVLRAFA